MEHFSDIEDGWIGENKNLIRISQVLKRKGAKIILLSASRDTSLDKLCDEFIYIDMNPNCESLNVGVATSIILYELDK